MPSASAPQASPAELAVSAPQASPAVQHGLDGVGIRPYRPADHNACRRLWGELVEHRGALDAVAERSPGDTGAGFEEYLTRLDLSGLWVAEARPRGQSVQAGPRGQSVQAEPDGVVGFVGLTLDGSTGRVDPVVVTRARRGQGIGRELLATVAEEARRRGLTQLTVSPSARDQAALRSLHAAGFGLVTSVTLSYALRRSNGTGRGHSAKPQEALDLYDLRFRS